MTNYYEHITDNFENEQWKDISTFDNYQVSNYGRVRRKPSRYSPNGRILKPLNHKLGYLMVGLYKDNEKTQFNIHTLVAEQFCFIPRDNDKFSICVTHRNGNKWDNRSENLMYTSHHESIRINNVNPNKFRPVKQTDMKTGEVRVWLDIYTASKMTGFDKLSINKCINGHLKHYKGSYWEYHKIKKDN